MRIPRAGFTRSQTALPPLATHRRWENKGKKGLRLTALRGRVLSSRWAGNRALVSAGVSEGVYFCGLRRARVTVRSDARPKLSGTVDPGHLVGWRDWRDVGALEGSRSHPHAERGRDRSCRVTCERVRGVRPLRPRGRAAAHARDTLPRATRARERLEARVPGLATTTTRALPRLGWRRAEIRW